MKNNMKEFFKNIDLMTMLFIIAELTNLGGIVTGFINDNQSAVIWAIASTLWCAAATAWYMCCKNNK